jgi:hypothetical protein
VDGPALEVDPVGVASTVEAVDDITDQMRLR